MTHLDQTDRAAVAISLVLVHARTSLPVLFSDQHEFSQGEAPIIGTKDSDARCHDVATIPVAQYRIIHLQLRSA